jgi:hypothetical protein
MGVSRRIAGSLLVLAIVVAWSGSPARADTPTEGRGWLYTNLTGVLAPNWAFTVMPGLRYEFTDSETDAGGIVMYELFVGPVFITKLGPVKFKLPLWYYYMGFPIAATDDYFDSHNLELVPIFEYTHGRFTFSNRTIFHNKLQANNAVFKTDSQRNGYSLLLRELVRVNYALTPEVALTVADEIFVGLVEDEETSDLAKGEPFFEKNGFSMNRLYAGVSWAFAPGLSVSPQYILETHHDPDKDAELTKVRHYLFVTFNYAMKLF